MAVNLVPIPESKIILDMFKQQVQRQPCEPFIGYFHTGEFIEATYKQTFNAVFHAAHYFKEQGIKKDMVVGYIAPTEVEYQINLLALMQLGAIPLVLSPQSTVQIINNLLMKGNAKALIYEERFNNLAQDTNKLNSIRLIKRPELNMLDDVMPLPDVESSPGDTAIIIHSSGSTSEPKLVPITHDYIMTYIDRDRSAIMPNKFYGRSITFGPMFHLYGLTSFWRNIGDGAFMVLPSSLLGDGKSIISDIVKSNATKANLLPLMVQSIIDIPELDWSVLANMDFILVAGALLPSNHAKVLLDNGVTLVNAYGSSETGVLATSLATKEDTQEYGHILQMWPVVKFKLVNVSKGSEGEEGQILMSPDDEGLSKDLVGPEGYLISDRIKIIKNVPGDFRFMILGRCDDVLIHVSGEKTNPISMEEELGSHPLISRAAMFLASNKLNSCVLIELSDKAKEIPRLDIAPRIHEHISKVNRSTDPHSRIMTDFVHILPFASKLPVTAKLNLARAQAAKEFADVISALGTEENVASDLKPVVKATEFDIESIQSQLRDHFFSTTDQKPDDNQSFFSQGLDSLSAVKFRTLLNKSYDKCEATMNTLYGEDTIIKLASYIQAKISGNTIRTKTLEEHQKDIDETISRFTKFSDLEPVPVQNRSPGHKFNVLITGANGSLGAFIIKSLFERPEIGMVFGLARANSKEEAVKRVREGLTERYVHLTDEEWSRFHNYPYDADDDYLGMSQEDYNLVIPQVDIIYHNAWSMDFLKGLSKFEDLIKGTVKLLKISAESPFRPAFHFTSTVGATLPLVFEQPITENKIKPELRNAQACNGYNLSKLTSEVISYRFAEHYKFSLNVHRVGQVGGDSESGAWNIREHVPLLIKASQVMGVAPRNFVPNITWIPVDVAGKSMVDIHFNTIDKPSIYINHIANPRSVPWVDVLQMLSNTGLDFKIIPGKEFIELLKTPKYQDAKTNPAASLTDYFTNIFASSEYDLIMATSETSKRSPSISNCHAVNQDWINNYVQFWKSINFLDNQPIRDGQPTGCSKSLRFGEFDQPINTKRIKISNRTELKQPVVG